MNQLMVPRLLARWYLINVTTCQFRQLLAAATTTTTISAIAIRNTTQTTDINFLQLLLLFASSDVMANQRETVCLLSRNASIIIIMHC